MTMGSNSTLGGVKAVVMAGGEGSRLRPLTVNLPKPLVPVVNRPIMEHIVELLKTHGITDIVTTLHYLADEIQSYFGDGADFGVNITHSIEDIPLGTAGSVKQAEIMLKEGTFIIISGDALTDCDLTAAVNFHRAKESLATLVLSRVPNPLEFGIVITDGEGKVERFLEKPGWGEVFSDTVNTGIYILEPEIFNYVKPRENVDWSKDVFPQLLAENAPMYGYIMEGYWCDVGTLEQYQEAQMHMLEGLTKLDLPGELVAPGVWVGENTIIDDQAELKGPLIVGSNTRIKRGARLTPGSVIGNSCLLEENAVVDNSVIWDRCYLGNDTECHGAIVANRVTIKRESRVQDGAVIGDRCLIDVGSTIRPRVKIWPDKTIERGSTVTMSLVVGNKWRGNLFRDLGVAGLSNIEITPEFATRLGLAFGSQFPEGATILAARDSARSSRMVKRSVMAALLSTGCQVVDMHGLPVPILRHFLKQSPAVAAVNCRKLPGNSRLSLVEFFDKSGGYMPRTQERKVEAAFFREDFHRADPDNLGVIEEPIQPVESYARDFLAALPDLRTERRPRIIVDYGYSSVSPIFPSILAQAGIEAISLNSFNDARSAPRRPDEVQNHLNNLQQIVASLEYDLGVLVTNEGETMSVVDDHGLVLAGNTLFAALCTLVARTQPGAHIVMSVTAPGRLQEMLVAQGVTVSRARSGVRDMMHEVQVSKARFAGNESGGFIFPRLHPGFDAMFALANMVKMLQLEQIKLSEIVTELPEFHLAFATVDCPWDAKGTVMRKLAESRHPDQKVELVDGIKLYDANSWVLVLPDSFEPVFHVFAESESLAQSQQMVSEYSQLVEEMKAAP